MRHACLAVAGSDIARSVDASARADGPRRVALDGGTSSPSCRGSPGVDRVDVGNGDRGWSELGPPTLADVAFASNNMLGSEGVLRVLADCTHMCRTRMGAASTSRCDRALSDRHPRPTLRRYCITSGVLCFGNYRASGHPLKRPGFELRDVVSWVNSPQSTFCARPNYQAKAG